MVTQIPTLTEPPDIADTPSTFDTKSFNLFDQDNANSLPSVIDAMNQLGSDLETIGNSATASATAAANSATSAANSATSAASSATESANSATLSQDWATKTDLVVSGDYSAKEYASGTTVESAKRHASGTVSTGSAKDWATKTSGEVVTGQGFGAKKYANDAAASAATASNLLDEFSDKYLGAKDTDPVVDNDGNPLTAGALYINTVTGYLRAYTGSYWTQGISVVAGVTSVNGLSGDVTISPSSLGVPTQAKLYFFGGF